MVPPTCFKINCVHFAGVESAFKTEEEELEAATNKLKEVVKLLKLSEEALLELIVGDGKN